MRTDDRLDYAYCLVDYHYAMHMHGDFIATNHGDIQAYFWY